MMLAVRMRTKKDNKNMKNFIIIGHRGLGRGEVVSNKKSYKENTVNSFNEALKLGVNFIETDVVKTKDNKLVLSHETVLEDGRAIADLTLSELENLGLDSLERAFNETPINLGMVIEVKHTFEDAFDEDRSTSKLTSIAIKMESSRGREIITYGFDASTIFPMKLNGTTIKKGFIAEGGTD